MYIEKLEKKFAELHGARYAIAMNSGTATLHSALYAVDTIRGDVVLSPALTVFMDTSATIQAGAQPGYVDVDPDTFLIMPVQCDESVSAIITVGLYGAEAPLTDGMIPVIEDNAQAFNGSFNGDMASYSFESSKHFSCGEGGILITNNERYAARARMFANHGYKFNTAEGGRTKLSPDEMADPEYERHAIIGYNYRMPEICAQMLLFQLDRYDEIVMRRRMMANLYATAAHGCKWLRMQKYTGKHSFWTFPLVLERDDITVSDFIRTFTSLGGENVRACWRLPYKEPAYCGEVPSCPNAEYLQPRLMQFKTNMVDQRQAEVLFETIKYYGG